MVDNINIDEFIIKATKVAIKEYDKEKSVTQKDKRLHNTRLLMKNYNKLKEHIENVNGDLEIEVDSVDDEVWITSITRTKLRTMKMMAYVDSALKILKRRFKKECIEYKYRAFEMYYIEEKTNEEIIGTLKCGKNQPKIWSDLVLNELSTLLWGIEALGM
ncbi:hypothetical protein [Clostridium botulinum]|uniref:hypothetical protein n=1 Tax=Clostridium botulinum TaxID=1491 RepID=UPI0005F9805A